MPNSTAGSDERCSTGVAGLDDILNGGLPRNRLYLVEGDPGVGKTTLAMQFLLEGARQGERGLYITLSETKEELEAVAKSHRWSLEPLALFELSAIEESLAPESQTTLLHPAEVELVNTVNLLLAEVERVEPSRVVLDSLSELRLLSESPLRFRRQLLNLKTYFAGRRITVLLLDDRTAEGGDMQVHSIAHGVLQLQQTRPGFGAERRRLSVSKLRGSTFRGGYHDYTVLTGGLEVFPRLVAAEHSARFESTNLSSGLPELDALLGGGLTRGTSTLVMGPAGTGKSTLALQFALHAAKEGKRTAIYAFDENRSTLLARARGLGLPLDTYIEGGMIQVRQIDPAELTPGEFVHLVRRGVEVDDTAIVVIDSLNGYMHAMPEEGYLTTQLHELFAYLAQCGTVTIAILAQRGLVGQTEATAELTYLADAVVVMRYFESRGAIKKAIAVAKKRSGPHEETIREFRIEHHGIRVGQPLKDFLGVLTGVPEYTGNPEGIMEARS